MPWPNIAALVGQGGHITMGRVAHVECVAIAADGQTVFATVVRRPHEPLEELLARLEQAVGRALYEGVHTNEMEGGHFAVATPRRRPKRRTDA